MKFGKNKARIDIRTVKFKDLLILENLPSLPVSYDVDANTLNTVIPESIYGNDNHGDCVIAARANHTMRMEYYQQKIDLPITTQDCLNEYWNEEGCIGCIRASNRCPDNGLDMLTSMNEWRQKGWTVSDKHLYNIYAFASIDKSNYKELEYAVLLLYGAQMGIQVPQSAINQFNNNQIWDYVGDMNIVGGHAIYIVGYNDIGPVCVTWGKKQQMTWKFYDIYCDEIYCLVDNRDKWLVNSPININLLEGYLQQITGETSSMLRYKHSDVYIPKENFVVRILRAIYRAFTKGSD